MGAKLFCELSYPLLNHSLTHLLTQYFLRLKLNNTALHKKICVNVLQKNKH